MMLERGLPGPSGRRRFRAAALAGLLMLASGLLAAAAPAAVAAAGGFHAAKSSQAGWVRLTHLSPNTPPVDVYLYSFGGQKAMTVLRHVAYGTVSPYEKLASGEYTVAMRGAGAKASSPPVVSANVRVAPGAAYTVAGLGPAKGLRLAVLHDQLTAPRGKSLVRVIQASLRDHTVTVTAGRQVLARHLAFGNVTGYGPARPGDWMVHVSGAAGTASQSVRLSAGTIHTLVVLDGAAGGLMLDNLRDAAGSAIPPQGGAATGLGGTAPVPAPSPLPQAAAAAAGAACFAAAAYRLRRARHQARHAR
jgi:Domain of unknown function (DUF4397)